MLFLRVEKPLLKYDFGHTGKKTRLDFQAALTKRLRVMPGGDIRDNISMTITSERREQPFEIGSVLYREACKDAPADMCIWAHASAADIEAIYDRARKAKYAYVVVDTSLLIAYEKWDLVEGNPITITGYDFRVSSFPCFGQIADQEPPSVALPPAPIATNVESKYIKWLFWAVLGIGLLLMLRLH